MPKFVVTATEIRNFVMEDVEAESAVEAMRLAEKAIDGWHEVGSEFTVDYAEEV